MRGQVEADVPIVMHGVVDLAVTGLAEVEGPPAVQLLAVGVVAYLGRPPLVHAVGVLTVQPLLFGQAPVFSKRAGVQQVRLICLCPQPQTGSVVTGLGGQMPR